MCGSTSYRSTENFMSARRVTDRNRWLQFRIPLPKFLSRSPLEATHEAFSGGHRRPKWVDAVGARYRTRGKKAGDIRHRSRESQRSDPGTAEDVAGHEAGRGSRNCDSPAKASLHANRGSGSA